MSDHIYLEIKEARKRGKPLHPGEAVPGCSCIQCTGVRPPNNFYTGEGDGKAAYARSRPIGDVLEALGYPRPHRGKAHCPIHDDRDPSMSVHEGKGLWYCFPCGMGGDGVEMVMKALGADFQTAIEWMANKC